MKSAVATVEIVGSTKVVTLVDGSTITLRWSKALKRYVFVG